MKTSISILIAQVDEIANVRFIVSISFFKDFKVDVNWKPPKTKDFEMEQIDYKRKGQQMKYQEDEFLINSNSLEKIP